MNNIRIIERLDICCDMSDMSDPHDYWIQQSLLMVIIDLSYDYACNNTFKPFAAFASSCLWLAHGALIVASMQCMLIDILT